jgi:hypothetical protein
MVAVDSLQQPKPKGKKSQSKKKSLHQILFVTLGAWLFETTGDYHFWASVTFLPRL